MQRTHQYIILRSDKPFKPQGSDLRVVRSSSDAKLTVEVAALTGPQAAEVMRDPRVGSVTPSMPMRLIRPVLLAEAEAGPAAPAPGWGLEAIGATSTTLTGAGVTVAVLDSGIDAGHEAFAGVTLDERDFTGEGKQDVEGHGTHCAGTIFGRPVGGTRIGVSPGVTRALIGKVVGVNGGTTAMLVDAIHWAAQNGAHLISMSLGLDFPGAVKMMIEDDVPPDLATSMALEAYSETTRMFDTHLEAIRARADWPLIALFAAAGNESRRSRHPGHVLAASPPANAKDVVAVGAVGRAGDGYEIACFSNKKPRLVGPGVDIVSAKPGGGVCSLSGTSMATPHVVGAAALWAEAVRRTYKRMSRDLVVPRLTTKAVPLVDHDVDDAGSGLVQVPPDAAARSIH